MVSSVRSREQLYRGLIACVVHIVLVLPSGSLSVRNSSCHPCLVEKVQLDSDNVLIVFTIRILC